MLEASGIIDRADRPVRDPGPHRPDEGRRSGAQAKLAAITAYVSTDGIPAEPLMKMAKLGAVIDGWMERHEVAISAVQCWTSLEEYFGVVPCTVMSMMSNELMSSACEVDICGVVGMHALRLASETPERAARLEQQLRRRSRTRPSASIAATCRSISSRT